MIPYEIAGSQVKLASFLYTLMRDCLPAGEVETLVRDSTHNDRGEPLEVCTFSNPFLAQYAEEMADRLTA